jgi:hypothetical protein
MKLIVLIAACAALAGCAGKFDNVLLCTLNCDRAFVASTYGPIGITAELREQDARELRTMQQKARLLDMLAAQQ